MISRGPIYRKLETPTLMIWGEEDIALGRELTVGTDELVSDLTLRYLPGVSHWVQQEAPETVNAMIEAWLDGREVPEARMRIGEAFLNAETQRHAPSHRLNRKGRNDRQGHRKASI